MAGALSQVQQDPGQAADPYSRSDRDMPPGWGRPLLDRATEALLRDLTERAPYEAQASAMFSQAPVGSLPGALGAGIGANLKTRLGMLQLPFQLRGQAARTNLEDQEGQRYGLENEMMRRNFGYMTAPWDTGEFSRPPTRDGEQDVTRPPAGGGGGPPVAGGTGLTPTPGGPAPHPAEQPRPQETQTQEPVGGSQANPQGLPVTDESRARLEYMSAQLQRAAKWSNTSPQARQDVGLILGQMTEVIKNDPLAAVELKKRETQQTSDIGLEKDLHIKATDIAKESLAASEDEAKALLASPNAQVDPEFLRDPTKMQAWIDQRAKQIFTQRYAGLAQQIKAAGFDPQKFLAEAPVSSAPLAPPPQTAQAQPTPSLQPTGPVRVPTLPDGAPLTDEPAPVTTARPALPGLPALPPERQQAVAQQAAQQPPPSPFVERQLTAEQRVTVNKDQEEVGNMVNTLAGLSGMLQRAYDLNHKSYSGPLGEFFGAVAKGRASLYQLFTGKESPEPVLNNTSELGAIISRMTLQNLQTLVKGSRMTNFELEYVQQLESAMDMTQGQRQRLFAMAQQIIKPRLQFEKLRASAFAKNQYIDPNSYEDWYTQNYGRGSPFDLSGDKPIVRPPPGG